MEGSSDSMAAANITASKFLSDLPSRGLFSSTVLSSNPGGMRVYVSINDTDPPEGEQIKTNQQNILIRSLTLRNKKGDSSLVLKDTKSASGSDSSKKRAPEKVLDSRAALAKKANTRQEGSSAQASKEFQGLTVERLRALLKAKGLSVKGKKDELISRLKDA